MPAYTTPTCVKSSHINPAPKSLHWLKIKQRIDHKILSLTYKLLTTTQPSYLLVLLRISKSCKWTDLDGFLKKSADPDADSDSGLHRLPPAAP